MKQERLFRAIADVGDDLIERAAKPVRRNTAWVRWGALAACLVLVIGVAAYLPSLFGAKSAKSAMEMAATSSMDQPRAEEAMEVPAETPRDEPEPDMAADAPAEDAPEAPEAPEAPAAQAQDIDLLGGSFTSAHLVFEGDMVVELTGEELEALLAQLRALPESGGTESFDLDKMPLVIRLFEGQSCTVQLVLPWFCPEDAALGVTSQEAIVLYESLIEMYF